MTKRTEYIIDWLRTKLEGKKAVIGLSGGIDSAVVLGLLAKAVGPERIVAVYLPFGPTTDSYTRARETAAAFEVDLDLFNIQLPVACISNSVDIKDANIRSRIRMVYLYALSEKHNGLVIGTTNAPENAIGYFTKYGDGGVDLEPIINLLKCEVYDMARELGVPKATIDAVPSAELWDGQTDEGEVGVTYNEMDAWVRDGMPFKESPSKRETEVRRKLIQMHQNTEHKRFGPYSPGRLADEK